MSDTSPARAARRGEIEAMLARYPQLAPDEIAELTHWFAAEASALDIGLVACNEDILPAYRAFRTAHIDPLDRGDWLRGAGFSVVILAILGLLIWRAF